MMYLFRQNDPAVSSLCYGRMKRTVDRVGCGVVAVYNVMQRLGQPQTFADVIADAQRLRMPWLFGMFGTKPRSLGRYFRKKNIPFTQTDDCAAFCSQLPDADAAIICTWNDKRSDGIHFYTVIKENGALRALNLVNAGSSTPFQAEQLRGDRFITGYLFSK